MQIAAMCISYSNCVHSSAFCRCNPSISIFNYNAVLWVLMQQLRSFLKHFRIWL